jgi:aspartyl-tRNA(Asn)/glutamyl-tRNA(Gln) amidotransferase subunit A
MDPACPIDDLKQVDYTYPRQARSPFNVTGSPAISVPSGFSKDGLPLGIQLIGAPFSEALLYRVAHAYEQASPWKDLHPTLV